MSQTHRRRGGFSLTELLLVLAIISTLVGLLIPAVQKVRESSSRTACSHNLRQLALGVHNYHDAQRRLPYGQFGGKFGTGPSSHAWSWLAQLLPYVEESSLSHIGKIPTATLKQSGVAGQVIPLFFCPTDEAGALGTRTDAGNLEGFVVGMTNYKGVSGANWGDDLEGIGPFIDTDWRNPGANGSFDGLSNGDGLFFRTDYRRPLKLEHIRDGTSKTFMIGEDVPALNQWCSWPYANNAYGTCAIPPNVKKADGSDYPPGDWQNTWSFRSRHPGGLNFAFADTSVRFIHDTISLPVYRALATYKGGEKVALP